MFYWMIIRLVFSKQSFELYPNYSLKDLPNEEVSLYPTSNIWFRKFFSQRTYLEV